MTDTAETPQPDLNTVNPLSVAKLESQIKILEERLVHKAGVYTHRLLELVAVDPRHDDRLPEIHSQLMAALCEAHPAEIHCAISRFGADDTRVYVDFDAGSDGIALIMVDGVETPLKLPYLADWWVQAGHRLPPV